VDEQEHRSMGLSKLGGRFAPMISLPELAPHEPGNGLETLGSRVRAGAIWAGASSVLLRFAGIAVMALVARIVAPAEFGVFSLALVVYGVAVSLAELGVASAVARSDLDDRLIAPTVATIAIVSALVMAGGMFLAAAPLAAMLGSSGAADPIRVLSICVALTGPFAVPGAQLQREFRQSVVFWANVVSFVISNALLIGLALTIGGALAFAWSRVIGHLIVGVIMWVTASTKYLPGWRAEYVRPLLHFGAPLALANLLSQVALNIDYAIVGRLLSATDVGVYALAFNVSLWSTSVLGAMLNSVVLPAFSRVRRDGGDQAEAMSQAARMVSLVAFPIAAVSYALAQPLIATLYGPKWLASSPVLKVLVVYGMLSVICALMATIIASTGRTGSLLAIQVVLCVALVPVLWFGAEHAGLQGVAWGHVAVICCVTVPAYLVVMRSAMGIEAGKLIRALAWPAVASVLAGGAAGLGALLVPSAFAKLVVGGLIGGVVVMASIGDELLQLLPSGRLALTRRWVGALGIPAHRVRGLFARIQVRD
jgi:lipopolysaccharide exporter